MTNKEYVTSYYQNAYCVCDEGLYKIYMSPFYKTELGIGESEESAWEAAATYSITNINCDFQSTLLG
jgi:hypothetical protein